MKVKRDLTGMSVTFARADLAAMLGPAAVKATKRNGLDLKRYPPFVDTIDARNGTVTICVPMPLSVALARRLLQDRKPPR